MVRLLKHGNVIKTRYESATAGRDDFFLRGADMFLDSNAYTQLFCLKGSFARYNIGTKC